MNILDIIILICLVPALIVGIKKGFISQVISILSIIVGIWASSRFANIVSEWLGQYITASENILRLVAFVIILVLVFIILGLLGKLLDSIIKVVLLGWVNRLLGAIFSLLKAFLILGLVMMLFTSLNDALNLVKPEVIKESLLFQPLKDLADMVFPYIKNLLSIK